QPHPISVATVQTASSSLTSPSSSSVTQTFSMPSDSRMRISSSLITWPFANNFFPPDRNTVQQRILPCELLTSTVFALIAPHKQVGLDMFSTRPKDESDYTKRKYGLPETILGIFIG